MLSNSNKRMSERLISIRGARQHNLKNISIDLPRNKLIVITGVSGSGKSSLAFDTIYAEGQRRFVESLSAYTRQFLERMDKPDVDSITGLPPAIAIQQKPPARNPRSTVGTTTEVYDYFRLLFGRIGTTYCKVCGSVVRKDTPAAAVERILNWSEGDKIYILFPLPKNINNLKTELKNQRELGFFRLVISNSNDIIDLEHDKLPKNVGTEDIFLLADRLVLRKEKEDITRLTDSLESAFHSGGGKITVRNISKGEELKFSSLFECADCEIVYAEPEPRLFSFNNPQGACPHCQGFGRSIGIDMDIVIPDKSRSIAKGAIHPFTTPSFQKHLRSLISIAVKYSINVNCPINELTERQLKIVYDGAEDYIGINGFFAMVEEKSAQKMHYRVLLSRYRGYTDCKLCGGSRIRTSARQVFIAGKNLPELIRMPLSNLLEFIENIELSEHQLKIAGQALFEIQRRLKLLVDIGLEYLTLDRLSHTLSGGEAQRINLSSALGSALVGSLYVLDEPSIGLHSIDTHRLLGVLEKLKNMGNTIIVVEHDTDIIKSADYIVDIGPKAGEQGGEIVFSGTAKELLSSDNSLTADYLTGRKSIEIEKDAQNPTNSDKIRIVKPRMHNLKMKSVDFPLNCLVSVTGVSGSGKSTLVREALYNAMKRTRIGWDGKSNFFDQILGGERIEHIELVDQSSIGKSSRSTPATYTKVFDNIRDVFAMTQGARQLGLKPGHFSFNVSGGRCEVCEGEGYVTVDMQFLPDVNLICESCKGTRYKKEIRNILFKGKSIVDVLNMTIDTAANFFEDNLKIIKKLQLLQAVGLGYLKLGQPSSMLSGGESQRIKLANHLEYGASGKTLFIFDEPTTGLHLDDISKLMICFRSLIKNGHSVVVIEHNLYVIAGSDWVIDLGPYGGERGGEIVAEGPPEKIALCKDSFTGFALSDFYKNQKYQ